MDGKTTAERAGSETGEPRGLGLVRERMATAMAEAGREVNSARLIAVSKTFGAEAILPVLDAGQCDFGENRVQEAMGKWPRIVADHADIVLHLIGPLQSNKAADAVGLFDVIHTIDRDRIAAAIAREMRRQERHVELLVQVNTGSEPQKAGIEPTEAEAFVARCADVHGLAISGLMCIPPIDDPPAPHFALLADLGARLGLKRLSMGMSADFETAIAFGATDVRVGTAIFGARTAPPSQTISR